MAYHFRNLVFEGGGVKGIAYVGALEALESREILPNIQRVGGASAGAIVATLVGLGYSQTEILEILWEMDFKKFMDSTWGFFGNLWRLKKNFGWYRGDFFREWIGTLIQNKTGDENTTFRKVRKLAANNSAFKELYFLVTNLSTGFSEIMSAEKTPDACIADAVRFSMSVPLFFQAQTNARSDVYVDGGVLDNYPVKLFDRQKYLSSPDAGRQTRYYDTENKRFLKKYPQNSPYVYNKETLGFRLDSKEDIAMFRDKTEPVHRTINGLVDFIAAIVHCYVDSQNSQHLHGDDWQRTIYIDTLGVGFTDFSLSQETKHALVQSGRDGVHNYFSWFDAENTQAVNKMSVNAMPVNTVGTPSVQH